MQGAAYEFTGAKEVAAFGATVLGSPSLRAIGTRSTRAPPSISRTTCVSSIEALARYR